MKVKVIGIQLVDYVSRKSGESVKGVTLHCTCKDPQVTGDAVESIFVSDKLGLSCAYEVQPGQMVDVAYNRRGYVCDLAVCK